MTRPAQYAKRLIKLKFMLPAFQVRSNSCWYLLKLSLILTERRSTWDLCEHLLSLEQKQKQGGRLGLYDNALVLGEIPFS